MAKKTRKQRLKENDAFLESANTGAKWVGDNKWLVTVGILGSVALLIVTWAGLEYTRNRNQSASALLVAAVSLMDAQIVAEGESADPHATPPSFADKKSKHDALLLKFQGVVDAAGRGGVAQLARFYIGDLQEQSGDLKDAMATFSLLTEALSPRDHLFFLAMERLAYLQEQTGDTAGAIQTLAGISGDNDSFYGDVAAYHQARLYMTQGDSKRARNLLEHVQKNFPTSSMREEIGQKLATMVTDDAALEATTP